MNQHTCKHAVKTKEAEMKKMCKIKRYFNNLRKVLLQSLLWIFLRWIFQWI